MVISGTFSPCFVGIVESRFSDLDSWYSVSFVAEEFVEISEDTDVEEMLRDLSFFIKSLSLFSALFLSSVSFLI